MRHGKPIKNKKHRDPRYFLNEGLGDIAKILQQLAKYKKVVCDNKKLVIVAIESGQVVNIMKMLGGKEAQQLIEFLDKLAQLLGFADLSELSQDEDAQQMAIMAVNALCGGLPF